MISGQRNQKQMIPERKKLGVQVGCTYFLVNIQKKAFMKLWRYLPAKCQNKARKAVSLYARQWFVANDPVICCIKTLNN